jgi:hypothetical protein
MKIIVDTNKYSGNFEREMCAFATAQIGECYVGDNEVDAEHPYASWWETNIIEAGDGCWRPVAICPTPGFINDGMGGHYEDTPENRVLANEAAIRKMIAYQASRKAMVETRLREKDFEEENGRGGWTEEACLRTLKSFDDTIERIRNNKTVYPAYQSIEILIAGTPPDEILADFESRIYDFANRNDIKILEIRIEK